jgi:hypothetical protein
MKRTPPADKGSAPKGAEARAARLKEALRSNLGRRKAQARARQADVDTDGTAEAPTPPSERS